MWWMSVPVAFDAVDPGSVTAVQRTEANRNHFRCQHGTNHWVTDSQATTGLETV